MNTEVRSLVVSYRVAQVVRWTGGKPPVTPPKQPNTAHSATASFDELRDHAGYSVVARGLPRKYNSHGADPGCADVSPVRALRVYAVGFLSRSVGHALFDAGDLRGSL